MTSHSRNYYLGQLGGLLSCYLKNASPCFSRSLLSGAASSNGRKDDGMEAFSRLMPALAIIANSSDDVDFLMLGYSKERLRSIIVTGIENGVNPESQEFWGELAGGGQVLCEASDIALLVWFSRDWIFNHLSPRAVNNLFAWLDCGVDAKVHMNNWQLFPATIAAVLGSLTSQRRYFEALSSRLLFVQTLYTEDGLFRDGEKGEVDGYFAWGFHYNLGMIEAIIDSGQLSWLQEARSKASVLVSHLIGSRGWPVFGRSIHYRMAISAPLSIASFRNDGDEVDGLAKRSLDLLWAYYLERGAISRGQFVQGYWACDVDIVEGYAGPASPLWCLRSLIPLLTFPRTHSVWTTKGVMPVEKGDYEIPFGNTRFNIVGDQSTSVIQLVSPTGLKNPHFSRPSMFEKVKGVARGIVYRPQNYEARYLCSTYRSDTPFFLV